MPVRKLVVVCFIIGLLALPIVHFANTDLALVLPALVLFIVASAALPLILLPFARRRYTLGTGKKSLVFGTSIGMRELNLARPYSAKAVALPGSTFSWSVQPLVSLKDADGTRVIVNLTDPALARLLGPFIKASKRSNHIARLIAKDSAVPYYGMSWTLRALASSMPLALLYIVLFVGYTLLVSVR